MFRSMGERVAMKLDTIRKPTRLYSSVVNDYGGQAVRQKKEARPAAMPRTKGGSIHFGVDLPLALVVFMLLLFGIVMVYSASYFYSLKHYGDKDMIINRQVLWLILGLMVMTFLIFFDYHRLAKYAVLLMGTTLLLLFVVLIVNEVYNGASRTLVKGSVQPSELAKIVTILYLAVWLNARKGQLSNIYFGLLPLAGILGFLGGLIIVQPDLSAVITIFALGGLMFFLAGGEIRQIAIFLFVSVLIGILVIQVHPTGKERIADYMSGLRNPTEGSYHVQRSLEAFVNGGWFGTGIGKASTKLTGLPVPPTDSIFAVVGEETGVIGASMLVCLYGLLLWRGLVVARNAPDNLGAMIAAGIATWISLEAFINMSVLVNLLPFAGNALPFISAGGSNLMASLAGIGILLNISRLSLRKQEEKGKLFNAFVDLRRRDGRRSVSGVRRSASSEK